MNQLSGGTRCSRSKAISRHDRDQGSLVRRTTGVYHRGNVPEVLLAYVRTNLTRNAASDGWPVWSPDGSLIAFASNRGGNENVFEIFVMRANGSDVRQLTALGFRSTAPEFSRDGRAILFTRAGGGFADLYLVPVSE